MPREILILCEYPTLNGGERSMLATLEGARHHGFSLTVAVPPEGPLADSLRAINVPMLPFRTRDADGHRASQDQLRTELATILQHRPFNLLHANSLAMSRLSGPVARSLKLPSIGHLRDIVRVSHQAIADLQCHTRLLAVSEATRHYHVAAGLPADRTFVLHNGVDGRQFRPRSPTGYLHRELGISPQAALIGTIGQIGLRKGHDVLVAAGLAIAERFPDAHFLIVGQRCSGKEESRQFEGSLHAAAAGKLAGRLHFLGVRDDVASILNELTLLVHPARQEPLGRVLLESAAAGVAVIATDVGGTREIFPPASQSARLVPADAPESLAAVIAELLADPQQRAALAAAARRHAEKAFSIEQALAGLLRHYNAVLDS
jgi:glycosyltransferase involved in cell wall biosynthesis